MATLIQQPVIPAQAGELEVRPEVQAPERPRSTVGAVVGNVLLGAGLLVLAFAGYLVGGSRLQQSHSQHLLYDQLRTELAHEVAPVAEPIAGGVPVAVLSSPRLGGTQVVVEGTTSRDLMRGPGHRSDTPLPGQLGVSVLLGKASTFGAPFARLHLLRTGDDVSVTTGQGRFTYRIDSVRRSDAPFVALPTAAARLSFITSDGSWTPQHVWVASGVLVDGTAQAASPVVAPAAANSQPLQGDSGAAVALLLWSQLLLVVVLVAAWGWQRLPRVTVWVGAAPVLLAVLWNVFTNLSALPPNVL